MENAPALLFLLALIIAIVIEIQAGGRDLYGWAIGLIALGLLWGYLPL